MQNGPQQPENGALPIAAIQEALEACERNALDGTLAQLISHLFFQATAISKAKPALQAALGYINGRDTLVNQLVARVTALEDQAKVNEVAEKIARPTDKPADEPTPLNGKRRA